MNKRIVLVVTLFCLGTALFAWGRKEEKKAAPPAPAATTEEKRAVVEELEGILVQATGRVRLVGSGLFPELVITSQDSEWYITKEEEDKLFDLQQQEVIVEGIETVMELTFANGMPAGIRRFLKDITIIKVQ